MARLFIYRPATQPYYSHCSLRQPPRSCIATNLSMDPGARALQRPKIWHAKMTASLRMIAALRPISTKEIDRIRDAQPPGLSGCGKARSRTACRSALISPPQETRVVLRSWRRQILCGLRQATRSIAGPEANTSASRILVLGARAEAVRLRRPSLCTESIIQVIPI